jgi:hypothetical protein
VDSQRSSPRAGLQRARPGRRALARPAPAHWAPADDCAHVRARARCRSRESKCPAGWRGRDELQVIGEADQSRGCFLGLELSADLVSGRVIRWSSCAPGGRHGGRPGHPHPKRCGWVTCPRGNSVFAGVQRMDQATRPGRPHPQWCGRIRCARARRRPMRRGCKPRTDTSVTIAAILWI